MKIIRRVLSIIPLLLGLACLGAAILVNVAGPMFSQAITMYLGLPTYTLVNNDEAAATYYQSSFQTAEEAFSSSERVARSLEEEGIVLLRNENSILPLERGSRISIFGQDSVDFIYGGAGSGSIDASRASSLKDSLEGAGFVVNSVLWDFYESGEGQEYRKIVPDITGSGGFEVNECPVEALSDEVLSSYADYPDAALVVIGRIGSESTDLPLDYLELTDEELGIIQEARANFNKVVLLLNTSNPVNLSSALVVGVDAIVWCGSPGQAGIEAVGDVLAGITNPSGRLVDTYMTNIPGAPAVANLGDFSFATTGTLEDASQKYMVYAENIYVGYRYYETRYTDTVLNRAHTGAFDYQSEVIYPFGFGLSYTTFDWSNYKVTRTQNGFTITVDVTNRGTVAGKDVCQVYLSKPYTSYDVAHLIEKASVELVGFEKTKILEPGESQTLRISVPLSALRSYDAHGEKTYILENGSYYLAIGRNAHDANNNILAALGKTTQDGMTSSGYAEFCSEEVISQDSFDLTGIQTGATGTPITNHFDEADILAWDDTFTYLSRNNWEATLPQTYQAGSWAISNEMIDALKVSYAQENASMPTFEADSGLTLAGMRGVPLNDPQWETLISQMNKQELWDLVRKSGYMSLAIESISMPTVNLKDGPAGISATLTGGNIACMSYPTEMVIASTFNRELAQEMGEAVGEDSLWAQVNVWYAPAMNIHRGPNSGRNFEYYAEDPYLSGQIGAAVCKGTLAKGLIVTLKHYALNDQETNRIGGAIFANEQSIREIYLAPYETSVIEGGANGVMLGMNRVGTRWTGGHEGLTTSVLRDEWGFEGFVTTDQATFPSFNYCDIREGLEAGCDMWLNTGDLMYNENVAEIDATTWVRAREAAKHILYTYANSNAINGVSPEAKLVASFPYWQLIRLGATLAVVLLGWLFMKLFHLLWGSRTLWQVIRRKPKKTA